MVMSETVRVLTIIESCKSNMGLIVVEANVERLTWNDCLYFNLIYITCAFHLPPKHIPLII